MSIDIQRTNPINLVVGITTPYTNYEKVDFRVQHKSSKAGTGFTYNTGFQAQVNSDRVALMSKVELNDVKKAIDLSVSATDTTTKKVSVSLGGLNTVSYFFQKTDL